MLEQHKPLGWEPWPAFDRKLLASIQAIRHFRHMVEGRTSILYPDHDSLIPSLRKKSEPLTPGQTYQLSCIAEYTTNICYLEGKANVVADQLSRPNKKIHKTIATINTPFPDNKTEELWEVVSSIDS